MGCKFRILTDHKSLKHFLEQRVATPAQQKWVSQLMAYAYEAVYRAGHENRVADALSIQHEEVSLNALFVPKSTTSDDIHKMYGQDDKIQQLIKKYTADRSSMIGYTVRNSMLFHKGRLVVPSMPEIRSKILWEFHASPSAGHPGFLLKYVSLTRQR